MCQNWAWALASPPQTHPAHATVCYLNTKPTCGEMPQHHPRVQYKPCAEVLRGKSSLPGRMSREGFLQKMSSELALFQLLNYELLKHAIKLEEMCSKQP